MKTIINVTEFQLFHERVINYTPDMIYRGVSHSSHKLIPKIGRDHYKNTSSEKDEQKIMQYFQNDATPFLTFYPQSRWEWWAIAQHHGLPTRFLDWTRNPLVAAYFAVENCSQEEDAVVYACDSRQFNSIIDLSDNPDPLGIDEIFLYNPPRLTQRITAQTGLFTVHNNPKIALDETESPKIGKSKPDGTRDHYTIASMVIKKEFKKEFKRILSLYGWNQATIYPGLDGIASHLDWQLTQSS
ncbi:MAG: FRG domain-containing protein [Spirochaetales bacterium]|nr:FRG domain-containing protein [Spirochaetales bacterium]